jgi:hypothetical protein
MLFIYNREKMPCIGKWYIQFLFAWHFKWIFLTTEFHIGSMLTGILPWTSNSVEWISF